MRLDCKASIWSEFCLEHHIREFGVPLFETEGRRVALRLRGQASVPILRRSQAMDAMIHARVDELTEDCRTGTDRLEGLIYIMYREGEAGIVPLYIGKAEKLGKGNSNLSANISKVSQRFCRWGDGYQYHVGDLSAAVCKGHPENVRSRKYLAWASALFEEYPTSAPTLKRPIYLWMKSWERGITGPWKEFGPTSLTFLEYQLIGVASELFPADILNNEGVNRK